MGLWSCLCGQPGDTLDEQEAASAASASSSSRRRRMYVRVPVRLRLCPDDHRTEGLTMHTTFDVTVFMDVRHLSSNTPSDTSRLILRTPIANLLSAATPVQRGHRHRRSGHLMRPSRPHTSMAVNQLPCETFATRAEMASWNTASLRAELQTLQTRGSSVRAGARTHADAPTHAHVADDKLLEEVVRLRGLSDDDSPTCSICLEDYASSDELRVLPCGHRFHKNCVDRWLRSTSSKCCLCMRSIRGGHESDKDAKAAVRRRAPRGDILRLSSDELHTVSLQRGMFIV